MKCTAAHTQPIGSFWHVMSDEGFRLFFPLSALYAALWPVMWVIALGFELPLAEYPAALWHAHEMIFGAWGAALLGFLTTAIPEWTDTPRLKGRALWILAAFWAIGRLVGCWGWDQLSLLGALADCAWLTALLVYLIYISVIKRTDSVLSFTLWLGILLALYFYTHWAMIHADVEQALHALHISGYAFLGLLGLALARISVPVTNLVLDPSEKTSPFRPHPGRRNLAPGMVFLVILIEMAEVSDPVSGFIFIACGAAFIDRLAEHFIGIKALRPEIFMLASAAAMAGGGMVLIGASRLGAPWSEIAGLNLCLMGGLGMGVLAVLCIAGRLHADLDLHIPPLAFLGMWALIIATVLRTAHGLDFDIPYGLSLSSLCWASAFLAWLFAYWPALRGYAKPHARPGTP